jgi:uncharacterized protein (DUF952 family)
MNLIYKILSKDVWQAASDAGIFSGAGIDLIDGYIHFSTLAQVRETARRHFAGLGDLILLGIDADALGQALVYEPSRGGDLFPHLYGALSLSAVRKVDILTVDDRGNHRFPMDIPEC